MRELLGFIVALWAVLGSIFLFIVIVTSIGAYIDKENCILPRNDAQMLNGYNK